MFHIANQQQQFQLNDLELLKGELMLRKNQAGQQLENQANLHIQNFKEELKNDKDDETQDELA